MRFSIALSMATLLVAITAKPVDVNLAKKEALPPPSYGPPAYHPKPYGPPNPHGPPKPYGPPSSYGTGSTSLVTVTSAVSLSTGIPTSTSSTVGDPIGFSNTSSTPGFTGFTPSFSSRPRTGTWTESSTDTTLTSTSRVTLTVTLPSLSTGASSFIPSYTRPSYNTTKSYGPFPTGSAVPTLSFPTNPGRPPYYGSNSTTSLFLTTGVTTVTTTIGTTSYVTIHNTTSGFTPSFSSRPRTGTWSLTGTGSTPVSPITNTRNSSTVPSTGFPAPTAPMPYPYPTAPKPYPYPSPSLSTGITLSTGLTSSTLGDPITNTRNTSTIASTGWPTAPKPYPYPSLSLSTGSTILDPVTASSGLPTITPSFSSRPRFPGTEPSTVSNLETFPTFGPDPTSTSTTWIPSTGFVTTATSVPVEPPTYGVPILYATTSYAGPGAYPYTGGKKENEIAKE
ncbi:hypothetical protein HII31_05427 [Pseudocercospora fuligena]|uniref:Uncharacterized protein n=1 Tax=Pseudocercospora fuligena TaxID=685502 RepID=A0A8H6RIQ1_9PEZI|nr:hypothetical protein HII31_05427 [Pseudocercospora fuligena]